MKRRFLLSAVVAVALGAVSAAPAAAQVKLFHTPDKNIGCALVTGAGSGGGEARCDIAQHSWKAPKKPGYCELDWGNGLAVDSHGRAGFVCAGDTVLNQGSKLAAGKAIRLGPYRCKNLGSAVRCVNRASGHGFKLSRSLDERF